MKCSNSKKGFIGILVLIIIVAAVSGGGVYVYQKQKAKTDVSGNYEYPATTTSKVEVKIDSGAKIIAPDTSVKTAPAIDTKVDSKISINGSALSVTVDGKVIQTLILDENEVSPSEGVNAFTTNQDVNFDGHNDIGVLSGIGYGGVNVFYDYYLYNSMTGKYDKSTSLESVILVKVDASKKQLINTYKSGPGYETQTIQWNGSGYVKSEPKKEF